ncbi:MAG: fimbrillin family protein [Prevotella sp.]|nr:fimbrillin family protein [Prevotella sp.]
MKSRSSYISRFVSAVFALLILTACSNEEDTADYQVGHSSTIALSSYRQQLLTRSDADLATFEEDTKYALFGLPTQTTETNYNWNTGNVFSNFPQEGTESSSHTISYTPTANFSSDALDFYALTYGTTTMPTVDATATDGTTPTITVSETSDRLPDLMHSNTVKSKTAADGDLLLPFEHACAAVNFVIAKQNEDNDEVSHKMLMDVKVTNITLTGVAESATMNLVTGEWTWTASGSRTSYSDATGYAITNDEEPIGTTDLLVIPNDDSDDEAVSTGEQIKVSISLENLKEYDSANSTTDNPVYTLITNKTLPDGTEITDGKCTVEIDLKEYNNDGTEKGPFHFKRNHKYTLALMVLRGNVRIVTVSPQVYEWADVTIDATTDAVLGQPVTIGGLMWMDRNVGATSADCENDWWHTCGHVYQYGRNIPYIINLDAIIDADGNEKVNLAGNTTYHYFAASNASTNPGTSWYSSAGIYLFYTYNDAGEKYYKWMSSKAYRYARPEEMAAYKTAGTEYLAMNPGDGGEYAFIAGSGNGCTARWAWNSSKTADSRDATYWIDASGNNHPENQPVPKGWRLPRRADGYKIMPEPVQSQRPWSDVAAYLFQGTTANLSINSVTGVGNYRFQYVRGRCKIDKNATPDADGLTTILKNSSYPPCVYGIKHQGEANAYRVRLTMMDSKTKSKSGTYTRHFLRIEQFASNACEIFKTDIDKTGAVNSTYAKTGTNCTKWNLQDFDWDHPTGYIDFPLQGYIDAGGGTPFWSYLGDATIMRIPEWDGSTGGDRNWTLYMAPHTSGVAVGNGSRRSLGDPIRLVRDITAE